MNHLNWRYRVHPGRPIPDLRTNPKFTQVTPVIETTTVRAVVPSYEMSKGKHFVECIRSMRRRGFEQRDITIMAEHLDA